MGPNANSYPIFQDYSRVRISSEKLDGSVTRINGRTMSETELVQIVWKTVRAIPQTLLHIPLNNALPNFLFLP